MSLSDALRSRLANPHASSFMLMGEDLAALTVEDLRAAAAAHDAAIPEDLRVDLLREEASLARECHAWLKKYNRSLYGRIAGYVELGKKIDWKYPWPVVAVLGIVQVLGGMDRARVYGLAGRLASRVGYDWLEKLGDGSEDVLRRTNRGIFADSVPTVLRAIRAYQLGRDGSPDLAEALIEGHGAVLWDAESAALCKAIADGLAIADRDLQFVVLSEATRRHFAREQAIFTHHIAAKTKKKKLPVAKSLPAPRIERGKLVWKPFALPAGFDFRDHDVRVSAFEDAFVRSVTGSRDDYAVATSWVNRRFA